MNTNQMHFNEVYARHTEFGQPQIVSTLRLAVVLGLSVADTSENAATTLAWESIKLQNPVFTLWAESEVNGSRILFRPEFRHRCDPHQQHQSARGRDRIHAQLHDLQARRT
jgi:acyl dehydratase